MLPPALFVVFLAGYPPASSRGVEQPPANSAQNDFQYAPSIAKFVSGLRGTAPVAAVEGDRNEKLAAREDKREQSPANIKAAAVNTALRRDEFWRLADRNRETMYAVLWRTLKTGDDEDADLRNFMLDTLDGRFDETPGGIFSVLVRAAPTPALRKEVLQLLAEASQELSVRALSRALNDPDPVVRQSAAASLEGLGVEALLDAMAEAVLDSVHSVRVTAFQTLEDMHGFAAIWKVAERVVDDPDPYIRKRALELISYGGVENALDHLTRSLLDPDPQVSELALALLAEFDEGPT